MSLGDGAARLLVTESVEQAHALRRREDEVEPGNGGELLGLDAALVSERVDALDRDHAGLRLATCANCFSVWGWRPRISRPSSPSCTTPSSPSVCAPRPIQMPGDSPRPA